MMAASSNFRSRMSVAAWRRSETRSRHGSRPQSRCARRATPTARSTSVGPAAAKSPSTTPVSIGDRSPSGSAGVSTGTSST
jgi:hypothetical protein